MNKLCWYLKQKKISAIRRIANIFKLNCYGMDPMRFIKYIAEDEKFYQIVFKNIEQKLFYSKNMNIDDMYPTVNEIFDITNPHYYEIPETTVDPEDIVLDCGAAEGLFSLIASRKAKQVFAIEPLPLFVESLRQTFNDIANVEILPIALGAQKLDGYISNEGIGSKITQKSNIKISIDTIDNNFFKKNIAISYIKADLEGYEMEMLEGARKTIQAYKPKIAITAYHVEGHSKMISSYLYSISKDYKIKVKGQECISGDPIMLHAWV